jgi:hypothetical protein
VFNRFLKFIIETPFPFAGARFIWQMTDPLLLGMSDQRSPLTTNFAADVFHQLRERCFAFPGILAVD